MYDVKNILLAVDFSKDSEFIGLRGIDLAKRYDAKLFLAHVVIDLKSHFFPQLFISSMSDDVERQMIDSAKQQLKELAEKLDLPEAECLVEVGTPKAGILKAVQEHDIDLIVVGSHGLGGVDTLLGSTADSILHKSPVDVFVVRLPN